VSSSVLSVVAIVCGTICVVISCVDFTKITLLYNYFWTMRTVYQLIILFVTLFLLLLLLLIVIWLCWYVRRIDDDALICWKMATSLLNWLSRLCPSVPPRIITILLYQVYVRLGDNVDCFIIWWCHVGTDDLEQYTDDSVTNIHDDVAFSIVHFGCGE